MTIKCRECNVVVDLTGKCPKCDNQVLGISGNAKITISKDDTEVRFQA